MPSVKFISHSQIKAWVKNTRPFTQATILMAVHKYYCQRLQLAGHCALARRQPCDPCRPFVQEMFAIRETPAKPVALLIWRAKDQAALANETFRAQEKQEEAVPASESWLDETGRTESSSQLQNYLAQIQSLGESHEGPATFRRK